MKLRKKKDVTQLKTLLIKSNASRENSEKMQKKDIPDQEKEIIDLEQKLK